MASGTANGITSSIAARAGSIRVAAMYMAQNAGMIINKNGMALTWLIKGCAVKTFLFIKKEYSARADGCAAPLALCK